MKSSSVISLPGPALSLKNETPLIANPIVLSLVLDLVIASAGLIGIFIVMHCSIIMLVPAELGVPLYPVAVTVAAYL